MKWLRTELELPTVELDPVRAQLLLDGVAGWEEDEGLDISTLVFYTGVPQEDALEEARLQAEGRSWGSEHVRSSTRWVDDEDWAHAWKAFWKPQRIGERLWVVPSWETCQPGKDDRVITLDPGMAFGTGTHETTRMCLVWLEKRVRPGMRVLDVGCGSGILAVAAVLHGAQSCLAIDNDPIAVRTSLENALGNGVQDRIMVREGNGLAAVAEGEGPFDLITANLVADLVKAIAPELLSNMAEGALFVGSGIIRERADEVRQALEAAGLEHQEWEFLGEWASVAAARSASPSGTLS